MNRMQTVDARISIRSNQIHNASMDLEVMREIGAHEIIRVHTH